LSEIKLTVSEKEWLLKAYASFLRGRTPIAFPEKLFRRLKQHGHVVGTANAVIFTDEGLLKAQWTKRRAEEARKGAKKCADASDTSTSLQLW
jgi:hypothetical protein